MPSGQYGGGLLAGKMVVSDDQFSISSGTPAIDNLATLLNWIGPVVPLAQAVGQVGSSSNAQISAPSMITFAVPYHTQSGQQVVNLQIKSNDSGVISFAQYSIPVSMTVKENGRTIT